MCECPSELGGSCTIEAMTTEGENGGEELFKKATWVEGGNA